MIGMVVFIDYVDLDFQLNQTLPAAPLQLFKVGLLWTRILALQMPGTERAD